MAPLFDTVFGQPAVRDFLRTTVAGNRVAHAYLFTGPAGSNKTVAAYAFAQAIICPDHGCMACDCCQRVMRKKHPDVRYFAPQGANGYLIEQIREIVADTALAPIRASKKVYLIDRADLLGTAAANAFLKTLEEPPGDVVIILLGRTRESVIATIVSRCQVVPFRHIPASEALGILVQNSGADRSAARIALEACDSSITRAVEFLKSKEHGVFRTSVLEVLGSLDAADDWDVVTYAADLVVRAKAPLDAVRSTQEADLAESADFLAKPALKQIEARNKRTLTAKGYESLRQLTAIIRSWLRDVLMLCAGTPGLVVNYDATEALARAAAHTDCARVAAALAVARKADGYIAYNVSPETLLGALLFEIREVLYGTGSTDKAAI